MQSRTGTMANLGFALAILILLAMAFFVSLNFRHLSIHNDWAMHTLLVEHSLDSLTMHLARAEINQLKQTTVKNKTYEAAFRLQKNAILQLVQNLRHLTVDNPAQQHRLDKLKPLIQMRLVTLQEAKNENSHFSDKQGKEMMGQIQNLIDEMHEEEARLLKLRDRAIVDSMQRLKLKLMLGGGFSLFFILLSIFLLHRQNNVLRQSERELKENEERFRSLYENVSIGLYRTTPDGRILMANPALVRMLGYSSFEELARRNLESESSYEPGTPRSRFKEILEQDGVVTGIESTWKTKNGTLLWVRESARLVRSEAGEPLFYEGSAEDLTERKLVDKKLRESEEKYRLIFNNAPLGIFHYDKEGVITSCNKEFIRIIGSSREQLIGLNMLNLPDGEIKEAVKKSLSGEPVYYEGEYHSVTAGNITPARVLFAPVITKTGKITGGVGIGEDITERKKAEKEREKLREQLLQSQKIESVGRLAGGVAHDYNNMLAVILGRAEMLLAKMEPDNPYRSSVEAIMRAGKRSADLTRQLLAFARKQTIQPKVLNLNHTIEDMLKMLRRLIGENIDLIWKPGETLWLVKMDPVQIDQILANLCVNARDAIKTTGNLTIETENRTIDKTYCDLHTEAVPGDFVMLAVSDDGSGMGEETCAHVFEPFFTTKAVGKGTGLGLATTYGIVKQNKGFINVYSEVDKGTTFRIYLPKHTGPPSREIENTAAEIPQGKGQKVLLVEDEGTLLEMAKVMLQELGYQVQAAAIPAEALSYCLNNDCWPDLLITDVVMPGMSGKQLADEITKQCRGVKVLFMSGYTANAIAHQGILDKGTAFIQKPFTLGEIGQKLKEVLDKPRQ